MEEKEEYIDLSVEQGKKHFKKEVAIEKYHKPSAREILRNAKEGMKKERMKARAFYEDKLQDKVEGTKRFLKRNLSNMKQNTKKGKTLFGNRRLDKERVLGSSSGVNNFGSGNRPFDSFGSSGGGVMNTSGRNVFSGTGGSSGGVFASGGSYKRGSGSPLNKPKKKEGKTIVIKL